MNQNNFLWRLLPSARIGGFCECAYAEELGVRLDCDCNASCCWRIPEIGQAWERGEQRMEIVDLSETRVWLLVRNDFLSGESYVFRLREKWEEIITNTMSVPETKFIPANDGGQR